MLDLAMPEFSGYDVIQTLKGEEVLESNNLVIFTASSNRIRRKRDIQKTLLLSELAQ